MFSPSPNTHQLLRQSFPPRAAADEWDIYYDEALDNGLAQKFAARHRVTGRRGLVKCGWPGTIVKEYLWSRLVRSLDLPAAPAQFVPIPDDLLSQEYGGHARARDGREEDGSTTSTAIGTLIHWIEPAERAAWLWHAPAQELAARGIAPATVVGLRALALWAGGVEPGEFMLAGETPFVIDMQDGLFIDGFGRPQDPLRPPVAPGSLTRLRDLLAMLPWQAVEREQAIATLRSLQGLSAKQIGWITRDADSAVIEATLPRNAPRAMHLAWRQMLGQPTFASHLTRLTQDWAETVIAAIQQAAP